MTPTPDTTPAAVDAMCERLDVFEDWLYAMDMAGLSEVQPNLHDTAAMLREVARERDLEISRRELVAQGVGATDALARAALGKAEAAEAEAAALREALRVARSQFAFYVEHHRLKSPPDEAKAATNQHHVDLIDAALKETTDGL